MNRCILVINVGSTSVKTRLFDTALQTKAELNADYGSDAGLVVQGTTIQGKAVYRHDNSSHDINAALTVVLEIWRQTIAENRLLLSAIGHRIVHGGSYFNTITLLDQDVLNRIAELDNYAPLHNPFNRLGVLMAGKIFADVAQYAVFDTAFHRGIPDYAGRYAIPENLSAKVDFYRYGFHGISCQYSTRIASELLGIESSSLNLIILHLGGGSSITAVRAGVSIDTSMGFSPTEGLMMATRCGDLDPMIALTLQREGWSLEQLKQLISHKSGLLGICGDADMRVVIQKAEQGDASAKLAVDMFCYRARKYIGAYCAVLDDVDALIFTGGIGEHAPQIRHKILQGLNKLGLMIDAEINQCRADMNNDISHQDSHSRILVIHAEEEREIAGLILSFTGLSFPGINA